MKRTITILSAALLAATAIHAQNDMGLKENQMVIGHTITNDYSSEGAYIGEAGTYPIGAPYPPPNWHPMPDAKS